ncbi:MAG TPA: extracellular solute-binding protein [Solirubrobacteraceae bacterium]|nr:extracellular solute-binding protein [Solirubrobacteraceae bacterium]
MRFRRVASIGLAAIAGLALAACGSSGKSTTSAHTSTATTSTSNTATSGTSSPKPSGTITLYNGQHEQTTALLVAAFEKQTGVKVKVRSDGEDVLGSQIVQEGANSPADVFYTENTPVLEHLQQQSLLAPLPASTLAAVPSQYSSPQKDWIGASARASALVYNTKLISPAALPSSMLALAGPQWKDKLGISPGETDFQPLVSAVTKLDGSAKATAWLRGLKANSKIYPDNEALVAQVNNGQSAVGLINHYYWYRLRDEVGTAKIHSALHYFAPNDPGNLLNVAGAAVLKTSANPTAAQAFVEFLVSKAGQDVIASSESYEYPLGSGVLTKKPLRPFDQLHPAPVSLTDLGDGSAPLQLEQQLGLL